jgi:hypothetical protein
MDLRELLVILVVTALGCLFIWYETGRERALLTTMAIFLAAFAVCGGVAVAVT